MGLPRIGTSFFRKVFSDVIGFGVGSAGAVAVEPFVAPFAHQAWEQFPSQILSPAQLADAVQRGIMTMDEAAAEAAKSGINRERFERMFRLAGLPPGLATLYEMLNRGVIDESRFREGVRTGNIKTEWSDELLKIKDRIISVAEATEMVNRAVISEEEGIKIAAQNGVTAEDFRKLLRIVDNPPGLEQLTRALRVGIIDAEVDRPGFPSFVTGVRQSRVRTEWANVIKELGRHFLTPEQVVNAAVQGAISEDELPDALRQAGLREEEFRILFETRGNPPGPQALLRLWRRGEITREEVEQGLRESALKNKWIDTFLKQKDIEIPFRTVTRLMRAGHLTLEEGIERLMRLGYSQDDAEILAEEAVADELEEGKQLTKTEILRLYRVRALNRDQAKEMLISLFNNEDSAEFLLVIEDFRRASNFLESAITRVRNQFVNHRINLQQASILLDELQVPASQREDLLTIWEDERAANVSVLTPAQIRDAAASELIPVEEALERLIQQGYSRRDASIFLALRGIQIKIPKPDEG